MTVLKVFPSWHLFNLISHQVFADLSTSTAVSQLYSTQRKIVTTKLFPDCSSSKYKTNNSYLQGKVIKLVYKRILFNQICLKGKKETFRYHSLTSCLALVFENLSFENTVWKKTVLEVTFTTQGLLSFAQRFSVLALIKHFSISRDGSFIVRLVEIENDNLIIFSILTGVLYKAFHH